MVGAELLSPRKEVEHDVESFSGGEVRFLLGNVDLVSSRALEDVQSKASFVRGRWILLLSLNSVGGGIECGSYYMQLWEITKSVSWEMVAFGSFSDFLMLVDWGSGSFPSNLKGFKGLMIWILT
ncbi:hypothetical protein V6N11_025180 [Hibiscus sabdariffa]|uniref:Uncharacterized protein n=1 Tax=Hibiscus sabdariffa TaxID=183260 RepID=A0ABR2QPA4_9ROSI